MRTFQPDLLDLPNLPIPDGPTQKASRPVLYRCLRDAHSLGIMEAWIWGYGTSSKRSNVITMNGLGDAHVLPVHVVTWGSDKHTAGRAIRAAQTVSSSQTLLQDSNS